ncbi:MAG TPA: nucleoside-diphosphate sugar epimerase/dehydratase [Thermoanaerobaculia bacterium]|nr:nucleoside-diphosphate sugar epimerase/dehydratase [Thermoanaerobaculia bacterium]
MTPAETPRFPSSLYLSSRLRRVLVLGLDAAIAAASLWLSMLLRFEGAIAEPFRSRLPGLIVVLVVCRLASSYLLRLHRWSFRFSGLTDGVRIGLAGLLGTGLFTSALFLLKMKGPPRSVLVLELLITTVLMAVLRFSPRLAWMFRADRERARRQDAQRTLIVGAGAAGEMLLRDLQRSRDHRYRVIGLVDDDPGKLGTIVGGKPTLGAIADLPDLVRSHSISKVLIAIPRLPAARLREILSLLADLRVSLKILPISFLDVGQGVQSSMLQDLSPEDLLPREPVVFENHEGAMPISGRVALVTGGAGSIGQEIVRQLLQAGAKRVALVDWNENNLYLLTRRLGRDFPAATIEAHIADVRDAGRLEGLFRRVRPQDVFHAAAHKHVPLMEEAPCEAVKNNVLGTWNVARAAIAHGAERFVFISTDKAVRPSSVMGATKRLGEKLVAHLARDCATRFCAVRFGNVLDSAGSVVPLFREQIAAGGPVTVTHPEVRRYFMTVSEAVGLVLKAAYGDYGSLCILEMGEQIRILDLARHLITMAGLAPDSDVPIVFTGLRPGEKLSEELLTDEEEQTHRIADKILVAESPAPEEGFPAEVERLLAAARSENAGETLARLHRLVPSYREIPLEAPAAAAATAPTPAPLPRPLAAT